MRLILTRLTDPIFLPLIKTHEADYGQVMHQTFLNARMDLSGPIVNVAQDFLDELKRTRAYPDQAMSQAYIKTL